MSGRIEMKELGMYRPPLINIFFTGTTRGRVLKVINSKSADSKEDVNTVVIEELQVFPPGTNIKELKVTCNKNTKGVVYNVV